MGQVGLFREALAGSRLRNLMWRGFTQKRSNFCKMLDAWTSRPPLAREWGPVLRAEPSRPPLAREWGPILRVESPRTPLDREWWSAANDIPGWDVKSFSGGNGHVADEMTCTGMGAGSFILVDAVAVVAPVASASGWVAVRVVFVALSLLHLESAGLAGHGARGCWVGDF